MKALLIFFLITLYSPTSYSAGIVYSNDVLGEIEPCGCRENPSGGVDRKEVFLKRIDDSELLQLDAGNLLFATYNIPEVLQKQSKLQAKYLVESYNLLGHDAVTPGNKDFAMGINVFKDLADDADFEFLSANLIDEDDDLILDAYEIFKLKVNDKRKKIKIAVIGLSGNNVQWPSPLKTLPVIDTAKKYVKKLINKVDYIVALTHQGLEEDKKLAQEVTGIDFIFGGHTESFLQTPVKQGDTYIFQSSFRNQYVGLVPLDQPFDINKHTLANLDISYEAKEDTKVKNLVTKFKKEIAKLNSEEDDRIAKSAPKNENTSYKTFPKCSDCHTEQFDFWRKTVHTKALTPLLKAKQIRNKECLGCHSLGLGSSRGFSNLNQVAKKRDSNPLLKGEKGPSDWVSLELLEKYLGEIHEHKNLSDKVEIMSTKDKKVTVLDSISHFDEIWPTIQCENCHQTPSDHPFASQSEQKKVSKSVCLKCHTANRAPKWYTSSGKLDQSILDQKFKSIACPSIN